MKEEMLEFIKSRRSTRRFCDKVVEQEKLETVLEAGRFAPSGGNSQSCHFIVITNKQVLKEIADLVRDEFAKMEVYEGMYPSLQHSVTASKKGNYVFHFNAPVLIAVANQKEYGNNLVDCACALENMMLEANALDLGSCWVNQLKWLNENPVILEYLKGLGLKESERVYGGLVLGYPVSETGLPERNPLPRKGNEVTYVD